MIAKFKKQRRILKHKIICNLLYNEINNHQKNTSSAQVVRDQLIKLVVAVDMDEY